MKIKNIGRADINLPNGTMIGMGNTVQYNGKVEDLQKFIERGFIKIVDEPKPQKVDTGGKVKHDN